MSVEFLKDKLEVKTHTDLIKVIENELGWAPSWDDPRPMWKIRATEVSKMKAVIKKLEREGGKKAKGRYTLENLQIAVEYLKRKKEYIKSPVGVVYAVERALEEAAEEMHESDLDLEVEAALKIMRREGDEVNARRLTRAQGSARQMVLDEWRASRG